MNEEPIHTEKLTQETPAEKNERGFSRALMLSLLVNGVVALTFLCQFLMNDLGEGFPALLQSQWGWGALWFLVNFLIMFFLYWKNQNAFKGMVAGFALGFLITIVYGTFWGAICFGMMGF